MTDPILITNDLHKAFSGITVLNGVSLSARAGEVVAIMGGSGSGKSTLLRCIDGLEVPDRGTVTVAGRAIPYRDRRGVREIADRSLLRTIQQRIGFVFQGSNLWSRRTILENLIEAPVHVQKRPRAESVAEAEALLARMGIADKRDAYPAHLSGGQQQRAAIARALAIRPELLLFDEPTSALDPARVRDVLRILRGLAAEGRTMLVSTHEIAFARDVSDRVVFLEHGRIAAEGPPAMMFGSAAPERFRRFCYEQEDDSGA